MKSRADAFPEDTGEWTRDELGSSLREFGVSSHAADVFSELARMHEATAGDLVSKTGIPDSKIYYVLEELVEKGLVEVQAGRPKTYRVVSATEAGARLQRVLEERYERQRVAVTRFISLLRSLSAASETPAMDLAYVVKGLYNVLARARGMIASARREVILIASEEGFVRKLEQDLMRIGRRGVKVKLAIPDIPLEKELERVAEIRSIVCSCMILVVDEQQMLTVNRTPDGSTYGITSMDETLVRLGTDYWESPRCCLEE